MSKIKDKLSIQLIRLLSSTWRIKPEGDMPQKPSVIAFWHGYMLPVWKYFSGYSPSALVSQSKDGRLLSNLLSRWGYKVVRGSSSKGGKEALESLVNLLDKNLVLITPDGPRGPACRFKAGAVVASQKAGVPLYLCSVHIGRSKILRRSWDSFRIPLPFTKITINISKPYYFSTALSRQETDESIKLMELLLNNMQK